MLKKVNLFNLLLATCLLAGCTGTASETQPEKLTCALLMERISETKDTLVMMENDNARDDGIKGIRTGGGVGVSGGSNSGVNLGVGISLGTTVNSYRRRSAIKRAEELRKSLIDLENLATEKECIL